MRTSPSPRLRAMPASVALGLLLVVAIAAPAWATDPTPDPSTAPTPSPTATVVPAVEATPAASPAVAPAAALTATGPVALPPAITFNGRGYGHGVGMSQYGARGRAAAGQDTPEILAHYFPGTTWGAVDLATIVRVQVLANYAATPTRPLRIYGRGGSWTLDGVGTAFPADSLLRVWRVTISTPSGTRSAWRYEVTAVGGALVASGTMSRSFRVMPAESTTWLQLWSRPSTFDRYRGTLRVIAKTQPDVINEVALEDYLRGVVPAEMPSNWPAAALRGQAIAARSYAVRRLRPAALFDVYDDTRSQVYRGMLAEKATTDEAIALTAGVVLQYGTEVANTFFHSSAGGATEANEYAWVSSTGRVVSSPIPYLRGGPDRAPDGTAYDATASWYAWQTASYSPTQLSAILAQDPRTAVGELVAMDTSRRAPSGRLISVTLVGTAGTRTVSADVFRVVFNARKPSGHPILRSTLFAIGGWPTQ